jgi:hypothetical protein
MIFSIRTFGHFNIEAHAKDVARADLDHHDASLLRQSSRAVWLGCNRLRRPWASRLCRSAAERRPVVQPAPAGVDVVPPRAGADTQALAISKLQETG